MAKPGFKPNNGFDKNPERASLAGRKSRKSPPELKEARLQNASQFESTIYLYMNAPIEKLKEILKDPTTPARDLVVIRILVLAIEKGDHARLNFLLERTIGKVADKHEIVAKSTHEQVVEAIELEKSKISGNTE